MMCSTLNHDLVCRRSRVTHRTHAPQNLVSYKENDIIIAGVHVLQTRFKEIMQTEFQLVVCGCESSSHEAMYVATLLHFQSNE